MMEKEKMKRLVVFSILMENGDGIMVKAPRYIEDKYFLVMSMLHPEALLDSSNKRKYAKWLEEWEELM